MKNVLKEKSYDFALETIKIYKYLCDTKKEYVLSKQFLRSGTAIGALIREAEFGQSKADFISKLSIALKEANETNYWLSLLKDSGLVDDKIYMENNPKITELIKLLVASIKTAKNN